LRAVAKPPPGQWNEISPDAEKPAETQDRIGYFTGHLVDHQPFDMADHVPVRPAHRGSLDAVARDQLMRHGHDVACHCTLHACCTEQRDKSRPVPTAKNETTILPFRKEWLLRRFVSFARKRGAAGSASIIDQQCREGSAAARA